MEDKEVEQLEEEKIEIVEHKESKYDNIKPRTEMSEITEEEITKANNETEQKTVMNNMQEQPVIKKKSSITPVLIVVIIIFAGIIGFFWIMSPTIEKPIIYIYPTKDTNVKITVSHPETLTVTYPKYNNGWEVLAKKDGTLIDKEGKEYYVLYWESKDNKANTIKKDGFIVKGEDASNFLEEKLTILGLNYKEREEFIIYWLPKLEKNKYNYIRFQTMDEINNTMKLNIEPKPDTLIRILMEFKPLNQKIDIQEQELNKAERSGYTVIEWGGTEIK